MATIAYGTYDIGATRTFSTNGTSTAAFNRGQTFHAQCTASKTLAKFKYVFTKKKVPKGAVVSYSSPGVVGIGASVGAAKRRAGAACSLISASTYGFIQIRGANVYRVSTDGGVAASDSCMKDEATAHILDTATNTGTQSAWICGYATAADSGSFMAPGTLILNFCD